MFYVDLLWWDVWITEITLYVLDSWTLYKTQLVRGAAGLDSSSLQWRSIQVWYTNKAVRIKKIFKITAHLTHLKISVALETVEICASEQRKEDIAQCLEIVSPVVNNQRRRL